MKGLLKALLLSMGLSAAIILTWQTYEANIRADIYWQNNLELVEEAEVCAKNSLELVERNKSCLVPNKVHVQLVVDLGTGDVAVRVNKNNNDIRIFPRACQPFLNSTRVSW